MTRPNPKSILITGASNGIGRALALHQAKTGVSLFISGQSDKRLQATAGTCRDLGAAVETAIMDVQDMEKMAGWIAECDRTRPLERVIANAGISAGSGMAGGESEAQARDIFSVNLAGVLNTVWPAIHMMKPRGHGQIVIISSLAGYRGLPSAPAYSASKAAVKAYGEGLRGELSPAGIAVNVVCPGFVESGITAKNNFPMPFLMKADKAAKIICNGLDKNKARIAFPLPMALAMSLISALPPGIADVLLNRAPRKG